MKRIVVGEHARLVPRTSSVRAEDGSAAVIDERLYDRLRRFDREGRPSGDQVFDWRDGFARTTQWVGVVQVPGLQVEILPKVDPVDPSAEWGADDQYTARTNLLYMLAVGGDVPVRSRDVARLATRRAPL